MPMPPPPTSRPAKRTRAHLHGEERETITLSLQTTTPVLGGGYSTRALDEIGFVRVPAIRGHLRFWWRALFAGALCGTDLYDREGALWGRAGDGTGGRSLVEITVEPDADSFVKDDTDISLSAAGAYALWPARGTRDVAPAPRWKEKARFKVSVKVPKPDLQNVQAVLAAWTLFGGIGGRTRRGAGSLQVIGTTSAIALPSGITAGDFSACLGGNRFQPAAPASDVPRLAGATLIVGTPTSAQSAWATALDWLRVFRQGPAPHAYDSHFARCGGVPANRPGRSNWPEADKVRHILRSYPQEHRPRHNATPVWPRAGFGLPIIGRFQNMRRTGGQFIPHEPTGFELRWARGRQVFDRLASPLIVKAVALAGGTFAPCALWLNRAFPNGGQVGLFDHGNLNQASLAPFDRLVASGDTPLYAPLDQPTPPDGGQGHLQTAFNDWLVHSGQATRVF